MHEANIIIISTYLLITVIGFSDVKERAFETNPRSSVVSNGFPSGLIIFFGSKTSTTLGVSPCYKKHDIKIMCDKFAFLWRYEPNKWLIYMETTSRLTIKSLAFNLIGHNDFKREGVFILPLRGFDALIYYIKPH